LRADSLLRDLRRWKEGDAALAREKQERIAKAAERIVGGLSIPGVKYAMDYNGFFGGTARLPCCHSPRTRKRKWSSCWRTSGISVWAKLV